VVKSFNFHSAVPVQIPAVATISRNLQTFLITLGFQKFWQKTWFQQPLFYYSMQSGFVAPSSDCRFYGKCQETHVFGTFQAKVFFDSFKFRPFRGRRFRGLGVYFNQVMDTVCNLSAIIASASRFFQ